MNDDKDTRSFDEWDDEEIREELEALDKDSEVDLDDYEKGFVENVVYKRPTAELSTNQRKYAEKMLRKYNRDLGE